MENSNSTLGKWSKPESKFPPLLWLNLSQRLKKWKKAAMAEWFKAADLRPAINDAWVRTPLAAK